MACLVGVVMLTALSACTGDARPDTTSPERAPKVLLIGIDGVRPDVLAEVATPNLDALAADGFFTDRTRTTTPSVSGPAWSSMLTGVWPSKHGVIDNEFEGRHYDAYPDFLTRIELTRPELNTFAVADWVPLMELEAGDDPVSDLIDVKWTLDGYELGWAEADAASVRLAVEHIAQSVPDAMFVYLGNPDETSHQNASIGQEYRDAIALADLHVGLLVEAIRARPQYSSEDWLIIVSTDHGRRSDGDHGGSTIEEMTTFILVNGPTVIRGGQSGATSIVDVAVTALTHMGIPIEAGWSLDGTAVGLRLDRSDPGS
ncbi:MAG: alkaline phosphatase family protein [Gemmatimonadetes bacterium]|nr:alkaline phosphatase family protein [Gemmatimonadota bacterium]